MLARCQSTAGRLPGRSARSQLRLDRGDCCQPLLDGLGEGQLPPGLPRRRVLLWFEPGTGRGLGAIRNVAFIGDGRGPRQGEERLGRPEESGRSLGLPRFCCQSTQLGSNMCAVSHGSARSRCRVKLSRWSAAACRSVAQRVPHHPEDSRGVRHPEQDSPTARNPASASANSAAACVKSPATYASMPRRCSAQGSRRSSPNVTTERHRLRGECSRLGAGSPLTGRAGQQEPRVGFGGPIPLVARDRQEFLTECRCPTVIALLHGKVACAAQGAHPGLG